MSMQKQKYTIEHVRVFLGFYTPLLAREKMAEVLPVSRWGLK